MLEKFESVRPSVTDGNADQLRALEDIKVRKDDGREIVVVRKGQTVTRLQLIRYGVIEGKLPAVGDLGSGFAEDLIAKGNRERARSAIVTQRVKVENEEAKAENRRQMVEK